MVSILKFLEDANTLAAEIASKETESETCRLSEYRAAEKIQKFTRGFLERQHVARLNEAATCIQKNWRGYKGRMQYVTILKDALDDMIEDYYNSSARTIQKLWRGFKTRTKVHNQKTFRHWLEHVDKKNKELNYYLENYEKAKKMEQEDEMELKAKENVLFILFKMHHLLRTESIPGTYSILDARQLSALEEQVNELNLTEYVETLHLHRENNRRKIEMIPPPSLKHLKFHRKCHEYWFKRTRVGNPSLMAQEKFTEMYKQVGRKPDSFREDQPHYPEERENPRMKFPLIETKYTEHINNAEPYTEGCMMIRDRRPSKEIHENDFVKVYKTTELSESYQGCKYGPFKGHASDTTVFIHKFEEKCLKKTRPKGNK